MSLTPNEAASALRDIEAAGRRSGQAFGYRISAPHLVIWGLVWVVGYGGTDLAPQFVNILWPAVVILGTVASLVTGTLMAKASKNGRRGDGWRYGLLVVVFWAFLLATYSIMHPGPREQGAFVPLAIAAIYAGIGMWMGLRYVLLGAAVTALTLFGFFEIQQHFNLWMAAVGGGGLIVAGLWMRSA
jgi:hypothetical protein